MSKFLVILAISICISSCTSEFSISKNKLSSPSKNIGVVFQLTSKGEPTYSVLINGDTILEISKLGFVATEDDFASNLVFVDSKTRFFTEKWSPVWGQFSEVESKYNELQVNLKTSKSQPMSIIFRAFDDGVAFRYVFPKDMLTSLTIIDEKTSFNNVSDHKTWWTPGCWENDEYPYAETKISEIDASFYKDGLYKYSNWTMIKDKHSVNTPVTMKTTDGVYISIHEAALLNFPGMSLKVDTSSYEFSSSLAGKELMPGTKAEINLPFETPWRTIQITDNAADLTTSYLIYHLNAPNVLTDTDWIKPTKYMGIWWEMHVGKAAWDVKSGKHGATTENTMTYIDFFAEHGIPALLIEGWNTGWEDWISDDREGIFDFQTPYPDFDLKKVVKYAKSKGVSIIGHHETAAAVETYEKYMVDAYKLYESLGIHAVKTGYVGKIKNQHHYEQSMVNHYNKVMTETAKYKIMLDVHEPIKQTGLSRTYPHLMGGEGMRGQEFNAWSDGNKPSHNVTLPFTRMLAGPMDFTPGIFDLKLEKYKNKVTKVSGFDERGAGDKPTSRVYSTLAHQLALYVVFYSPIQMVADLPENYINQPAFQFIKDVGVDWEWTKVVDAEIASHIVTVRKEKNDDKWFIGGISGDTEYTAKLSLDFLPDGKTYNAVIYRDDTDTDMLTNPEIIKIESIKVDNRTRIDVLMKSAGGFALSIMPSS
jgi:hypothetical protein